MCLLPFIYFSYAWHFGRGRTDAQERRLTAHIEFKYEKSLNYTLFASPRMRKSGVSQHLFAIYYDPQKNNQHFVSKRKDRPTMI